MDYLENNGKSDLCIPIYVTAKAFKNLYTRYLKDQKLTFTQFIVMKILWQEKELMLKEIGRQLDLDSGTLSPVLKKLEEKGYIVKEHSADDARDVVIRLTESGQKLRDTVDDTDTVVRKKLNIRQERMDRMNELLSELLPIMMEVVGK